VPPSFLWNVIGNWLRTVGCWRVGGGNNEGCYDAFLLKLMHIHFEGLACLEVFWASSEWGAKPSCQ